MKEYAHCLFRVKVLAWIAEGVVTFGSELESFGDGEHNLWNLLLGLLAHHTCSPVPCHFAQDALTIGNVQVTRERWWSGARLSDG